MPIRCICPPDKRIPCSPTVRSKYDVSSIVGIFPGALGFGSVVIYNNLFFVAPDNPVELPGCVQIYAATYFEINEGISDQVDIESIGSAKYWRSAHRNNRISSGAP
jgi:hypothetical protein